MNLEELWEVIQESPDYEISSFGRVHNLVTGTYLKRQFNSGRGYYHVRIPINGIYRTVTIHKLVANHFIGSVPKGMTVNHKDGDKANNHVSNLEIATYSDNNRHAFAMGLKQPTRATKRVMCVETNEVFESIIAAGKNFNMAPQTVSNIVTGRIKSSRGLTFKLVSQGEN